MIFITQGRYGIQNLEVCAEIQAAVHYDNAIESGLYAVGRTSIIIRITTMAVAVFIDMSQNVTHDFDVFPVFVFPELCNDPFEFGSVLERINQSISGAQKRGHAV